MSIFSHIRPNTLPDPQDFVRVLTNGHAIGWMPRFLAMALAAQGTIWGQNENGDDLYLSAGHDIEQAVDDSMARVATDGIIPVMPDYSHLGGVDWIAVCPFGRPEKPLFRIKRYYARFLGVQSHSIILHGFNATGYWVSTRGQAVHDFPGRGDVLAAGMITADQTPRDCLCDEAWHEAGLTAAQLAHAVETPGLYQYYIDTDGCFRNEYLHIFELDTQDAVTPHVIAPLEVARIDLLPVVCIIDMVENDDFLRPLIVVLVVEFLLRHGHITSDHTDFAELSATIGGLRRSHVS